ncbi:MAG: TonB-dependent receptor [Vicinamibacterales bacterium]
MQVPVARSRRATAGASYRTRNVLLDLTLFRTRFDDVTLFAPRLTPGDVPVTTSLFVGTQQARGAELFFQQRAARQSGWVSYTLSDVRQRFTGLEADAFAATQDERHRIKVVESVNVFRNWTMAGTWVFGSGRSYTPATGIEPVTLPVGLTVDGLLFGTTNSARLPAYHRLDASVQNTFHVFGIRGTVGATLFNVYDRKNVWYRSYQTFGGLATSSDVTYLTRAINAFVKIGF